MLKHIATVPLFLIALEIEYLLWRFVRHNLVNLELSERVNAIIVFPLWPITAVVIAAGAGLLVYYIYKDDDK